MGQACAILPLEPEGGAPFIHGKTPIEGNGEKLVKCSKKRSIVLFSWHFRLGPQTAKLELVDAA